MEAYDALEYLTKDGDYDDLGLAAIRTIRAALQTQIPEWQPIETAPKGDDHPYSKVSDNPATFVLVASEHHVGVAYCMYDDYSDEYVWYAEDGPIESHLTHWKHLDKPPISKDTQERE